jgi:hypothetical protein
LPLALNNTESQIPSMIKNYFSIAVRHLLRHRAFSIINIVCLSVGISIIILFLKEYASLILIANLIAWPLAYLISNHWLENFAYRIHQDIFSYVSVFVLVFVIAFGVIIIQCFKVAIANPVASLRSE